MYRDGYSEYSGNDGKLYHQRNRDILPLFEDLFRLKYLISDSSFGFVRSVYLFLMRTGFITQKQYEKCVEIYDEADTIERKNGLDKFSRIPTENEKTDDAPKMWEPGWIFDPRKYDDE